MAEDKFRVVVTAEPVRRGQYPVLVLPTPYELKESAQIAVPTIECDYPNDRVEVMETEEAIRYAAEKNWEEEE